MLLGLVGLIGSGKDTVAERLVSHHGFRRDSFAQSLKDAVSSIFLDGIESCWKATPKNLEHGESNQMHFGQKNLAKK
jgi:dephospho-CoA kinase